MPAGSAGHLTIADLIATAPIVAVLHRCPRQGHQRLPFHAPSELGDCAAAQPRVVLGIGVTGLKASCHRGQIAPSAKLFRGIRRVFSLVNFQIRATPMSGGFGGLNSILPLHGSATNVDNGHQHGNGQSSPLHGKQLNDTSCHLIL